jgi:uncharacterized repeat protein (TIGR01451 family)
MSRGTSCTTAVARRSRILFTSFGFSLAAAISLAVVLLMSGSPAAASTCSLTSTAPSFNWSDTTKWSGCAGTYPNLGDTAIVGLGGSYVLHVNVPVNVVLQIQTTPVSIAVDNTMKLEASSTAVSGSNITINSGGTLQVASGVNLAPNVFQSNFTISNGGTLELQGGSQLTTGNGSSFVFAGGQIKGPGALTNPLSTSMAWTGAGGAMSLTNALIFSNNGTVNLVSSTNPLSIDSGSQFNNQSGASFSLQTSIPIATDGLSAPAINNNGSMIATSGNNPTINVPVNNTAPGSITLSSTGGTQTLTLAGGGTHTGSFNTASPPIGIVAFNGPHNFNSGWSWNTGPSSTFKLLGGTSTVNANFVTPFFIQDGGTLAGTGTMTVSSGFDWNGGTQTGSGTTSLFGGALSTIDGTSTCTLDGGRILNVQSSTTLTYNPTGAGSLAFTNSGVMSLNGTLDIKSDTPISSDGSAVINLSSTGTMTKTAGTRTDVQPNVTAPTGAKLLPVANTIAFSGGATIGGLINTSTAGSFIEFSGNTSSLNSGTTVSSGNLKLTGGTLNIATPLTIASLAQSNGTLKGTQTLTVANVFDWTGGSMDGDTGGTGNLTIATPNGIANINGGAATTIIRRFTFTNGGTVHYQPAVPLAVNQGGQITNSGSWNLENGTAITSDMASYLATSPAFTNSGLLQKTISGPTSFGVPLICSALLTLNNSADLELTGGGTLGGGMTLTFNNPGDVLGIVTNPVTIPLTPAISINGPGVLRVDNTGTLINNGPNTTLQNFEIRNGGTSSGSGLLNITSNFKSTGGFLGGGGTTKLANGANGDLTALSGNLTLNIHTFDNFGTINYNPTFPIAFSGAASFINEPTGILNITGPGGTQTSGTANSFDNQGTINRSGAPTFFTFDLPFTNSGTVDAQSASTFVAFSFGGSMSAGVMKGSVASAGIEFGGGTFNVTGGNFGTAGGVKINGGTLNINTAVAAPAQVVLLSGTLGTTAAGTLSMNAGSTLNLNGGTVSTLTLNANTSGAVNFDTTSNPVTDDAAIIGYNVGSFGQWIGSQPLVMNNGASIVDSGTVTWGGSGNVTTAVGAAPIILVNPGGILQKTTSASPINVGVKLQNNGGTIDSSAGALELAFTGGSSHSGTFSANSPGSINFTSGPHSFTGVTGSGSGALRFLAGTITMNDATSLSNLYLGASTLTGPGPLTFSGAFDFDGGTLNVPASASAGGTVNFLGSVGAMAVNQNLTSGGTFSSPTNALNINGGATYTNNGTLTVTGAAPINGAGTFTNSGTLTKSAGGTTAISPTFNNDGSVNASGGMLQIAGSGTDNGSYSSAAGQSIGFEGGVRTLSASSVINSSMAGLLDVGTGVVTSNGVFTPGGTVGIGNAGTLTLNTAGTATIANLVMSNGTLSGSSAVQLAPGTHSLFSATITGTGSFTNNGTALLSSALVILDGRTWTNSATGTMTFSSAGELYMINGAALVNQSGGTIDLTNNNSITNATGPATFSNAGTFIKSCCLGNNVVEPVFTNTGTVTTNAGQMDFTSFTQSAGTTNLSGGALSSAAVMNFSGGTLTGDGQIIAAVTNSGATIDPLATPSTLPGTITIGGTFNQTGTGTLILDLFNAGTADKIDAPGQIANLAGNLQLQYVTPYVPANGDSFVGVHATTLTDTSAKSWPPFGPANTGFFNFAVQSGTDLIMTAVVPQADVDVSATTAPATVLHNNTWNVTIPVTNNGTAGATNVIVTVNPTNGTLNSLSTTLGTCGVPTANQCTIGNLGIGATATVSAGITATTLPSVSATATAAANESDPNGTNNSKTVSATVTPSADLTVSITDSPDPVNAGATVNYTATVTNNGPDTSGATLTLAISGGGTFGTLPAGCTNGPASTIICTAASIGSGGSVNFVVPVVAPGAGPVSLTGNVAATGATDTIPANNGTVQSTTVTPKADLSITKSGPGSAGAGSNVSYTIVVTNNGPSDATSVVVSDPPVAGLTWVSNSGACTTSFPCTIASLTNGSGATILATYSTSPSGPATNVTNTASVASSIGDPNGGNNSASATTAIGQTADVQVTVTGSSNSTPGSNFALSVKIMNNGPSVATGISVSLATSSAMSFESNSGACTTAYPCAIASLNPGQFVTINSMFSIGTGGTSGTATFTATTSSTDSNSANNSVSKTVTTSCPSNAPTQLVPQGANLPTEGILSWNDVGAASYNVYLGPAGSGCTTFYGARSMSITRDTQIFYALLQPGTQYEWAVEAVTPNCQTLKSSCVTFTTQTNCNASAPQPVSPVGGTVSSPVTFSWTPSTGATLYTVKNAADDSVLGTSVTTSLPNIVIPDGPFTWYVVADVPQCGALRSANATFNACSIPTAPIVGAVSEATTGQTYSVQWDRMAGVVSYDLEEANNPSFNNATVFTIQQPAQGNISVPFTKSTTQGALSFFYRARAKSLCGQAFGPYSTQIRVVVLPPAASTQKNPSVTVPVGSTLIVVQQVFVPGLEDGLVHTFTATVDKPWLTVDPASGILPAGGVTLNVKADPANLPNGTETGTVIVTINSPSGKTGTNGATVVSVPISVNLVTPVIPSSKDLPPDNTLIIPSVGHLDGVNSHWQSDIRLANTGGQKLQYALKFTPSDPTAGGVKTTTINVDGGATTALDDIVKNWYGIGTLGESANGVLEVRPLTPSNKGLPGSDAEVPSVSKVTVVSSRTYTVGDNGTLGQFIPAIPFSNFIGKATQQAAAAVLSLQQIAQSAQYRTNVGIVEGSGQPASVLLSIFDVTGKKLKDVPLSLKGGEQMQLGSFLAAIGIPSLSDGRIEVKVTSGEGRVTAYASVVDNQSLDPLLVSGVKLGAASASKYVVPGVADINTGLANWRTDMRIFNGGLSAQNAVLTFFRQGASPLTQSIVINAGEIRTLDSIVASLFGVDNSGGAVHVSTSGNSNLIVTGRTYNATSNGTFGQFIPAVTPAESIASGDRPLQILQAEDSVRYRTNLGLAEVTGKPAGVDISINLPDSKVTPVVHVDLAANDFQQFNVFKALGLENTYNARITVRVTTGDGRVTAYGSVIDMLTSDPTYVPAQQ